MFSFLRHYSIYKGNIKKNRENQVLLHFPAHFYGFPLSTVPPYRYNLETIITNLGITPVSELKHQNHLYTSI